MTKKELGLSTKNTKQELIEAYEDLLLKVESQEAQDPRKEVQNQVEQELIVKVSQHSLADVVSQISNLKLTLTKSLDTLGGDLTAEVTKFTELQKAVELEKKQLESLYQIKLTANSFTSLLLAQKGKEAQFNEEMTQKKVCLEQEIAEKKLQWKKEQEQYDATIKEQQEILKKDRKREEDEYRYNLELNRKKDQDQYETKKLGLEKVLIEKQQETEKALLQRETAIFTKEQELADLKSRVENFPKELDKEIKDTEKSITEKLEYQYKFSKELTQKELDGERKLNKQIIASLEQKIKEQEEQIKQLSDKANEAGVQVQAIAVKAIEGASGQRLLFSNPPQQAMESTRMTTTQKN